MSKNEDSRLSMEREDIIFWLKEHAEEAKEYLYKEKLPEWRKMTGDIAISPWKLAKKFNLTLLEGDLKKHNIYGFLRYTNETKYQIVYEETLPVKLRRYVILHELMHWALLEYCLNRENAELAQGKLVFDMFSDLDRQLSSRDPVERLCDNVAIELLMPASLLNTYIDAGEDISISAISNYFTIDEKLVRHRLKDKG